MSKSKLEKRLDQLAERFGTPRPVFELCDVTSKGGDFTIVDSTGDITSVEGCEQNDFTNSKDPRIRVAECLVSDERVARLVLQHEFAHFLSFREHQTSDKNIARQRPHGQAFQRHARRLDAPILNEPEKLQTRRAKLLHKRRQEKANYRLFCGRDDCSFETVRQQKSKPVKNPDRYGCPECGGRTLVVDELNS